MTRLFSFLAVFFTALIFTFLAVQPSVAQPSSQESLQDGQPESTPQPTAAQPPPQESLQDSQPESIPQDGKSDVDWANVKMESEEESDSPHSEVPIPIAPAAPDGADLLRSEDDEENSQPSDVSAFAPATEEITHVVQAGENLYRIARDYGISLEQIIAANNIQNPDRLQVGQVLIIPGADSNAQVAVATPQDGEVQPSGNTYRVQRGDSPYKIAQRFGVSVEALIAVNQIDNPRRLDVGQVLTIPQEGDVPVVVATPVPPTLTAEPTMEPATPERTDQYVVQRGDKPYEIAQRFGVSVEVLMAVNHIDNPRRMNVGQVLTIPQEGDVPVVEATPVPPTLTAEPAIEPATTAIPNQYEVQRGDKPYEIAQRFGVSVEVLMAVNQIDNPRRMNVGQVLTIPQEGDGPVVEATPVPPTPAVEPAVPVSPDTYTVQRGDNLSRIARRLGVTNQALIEANNLTNPDRINAGQTLTIPGTTNTSPPENPTTSPPDVPPESTATPQPNVPPESPTPTKPDPSPIGSLTQTSAEVTTNQPVSDAPFIWPIHFQDGQKGIWYSGRHPGIDIILPIGTPIRAAAGGTVEFSGWNAYGFGNLVVLDHGNGYRTLYAHQSERLVATGDTVAQGDVIGRVGITGQATHPHLHFEIRQAYTPVYPCDYLPGGCQ